MRNEIRRSQIDGWLTGVDRHIALTSVKKLRRANRWLSPTVQLFPFADTDCCACKKSRSVKNIHLCRGGDGGFLLVLDERNREQAPTLFALPKQVWYPRVKQHLHGPLERSAHSSFVFPRNAHRFCTTQSEKDKTTQISKIQIYMVRCTCRRRGRAPFSLNFLSTDQAHASGRVKGQLGFERLSKSCAMSGTWENGPLFQFKLCVTMVFRFTQRRRSDQCRWSSNDLCFSLWKNSDTRSPPLRREERLHGLFFFGLRTVFVSRSDRRKKESKQTAVFVRSLDGRKQKKRVSVSSRHAQ